MEVVMELVRTTLVGSHGSQPEFEDIWIESFSIGNGHLKHVVKAAL